MKLLLLVETIKIICYKIYSLLLYNKKIPNTYKHNL